MADRSWARLERLFERARELDAAERAAFVEAECAGDPTFRNRLESLLAAHDEITSGDAGAAGFLESLDEDALGVLLGSAGLEPDADQPPTGGASPDTIGRYRVVRQLGRGGMGVVYLARDPTLDRPVALKLLSGRCGSDPPASRRLVGEARAASALDHPNIGTVYEIGDGDDGPYIAMAYYPGHTVRERVTAGPLDPEQAIDIALQVAEGLAAAHAAGIVHRDIKPENLIVTPPGLVKIVDFGVAKVDAAPVTAGVRVRGTAGYMSPEQTRGEAVDGRCDIWAVGVVLYEMLTGERPFDGDSIDALIYGIRHDTPVPVLHRRPDIHPALPAVLDRCLAKSPADRFSSARELAEALRALTGQAAAATGRSPRRGSESEKERGGRRRTLAAAAAVAVAASIAAALALNGDDPVTTPEPLILADFTASDIDPDLGRVVTEALRIDLLQSPALRLAEMDRVAEALRRADRDPAHGVSEAAARELALRDGYKGVVTGTVSPMGTGYLLTARIIDPAEGVTVAGFRETALDSTGLIAAVDRLSKRVRDEAGESLRSLRAASPLPDVATASLPALRLYAEAYTLNAMGGDQERAAALLRDAVSLDSTFAAAYRALSTTYWNTRAERGRTVAATRAAYELRHRLAPRERYLAEAVYHWQVRGDVTTAADAYRRVLALDPGHSAARNNLGLALLFDSRPFEAERILREGGGSDDQAPVVLRLNVARALYLQGRTEAALAVIDSAEALAGGSAGTRTLRIRLLGADGRWDEAEAEARALLDQHRDDRPARAEALRTLWNLALVRGRVAEAESLYTEMAALLDQLGSLDALARATVRHAEGQRTIRGDPEGARATLHSLMDSPHIAVLEVGASIAPRTAAALAAVGDTAAAVRLLDAWGSLPEEARGDPDRFTPALGRARVHLVGGRADAAVALLDSAATGTIQAINYLPDLGDALRRAGQRDSAIAVFERYLEFRHPRRLHRLPPHLGPSLLQLADLYEEVGDTVGAISAHAALIDLWREADPELQPRVDHARSRVASLSVADG